jgi:hypothetical protein
MRVRTPALRRDDSVAVVSPKTNEATASDATAVAEEPVVAIDYNLPIDFNLRYDDFAAAIAALDPGEQALLWNQRLRHYAAKRQAQASRKAREAAKRQKAAKKRAEASRRRNAAQVRLSSLTALSSEIAAPSRGWPMFLEA